MTSWNDIVIRRFHRWVQVGWIKSARFRVRYCHKMYTKGWQLFSKLPSPRYSRKNSYYRGLRAYWVQNFIWFSKQWCTVNVLANMDLATLIYTYQIMWDRWCVNNMNLYFQRWKLNTGYNFEMLSASRCKMLCLESWNQKGIKWATRPSPLGLI